jgi:hypothetical protein
MTGVEDTEFDVTRVYDEHVTSFPTISVDMPASEQAIVLYASGHQSAFGDSSWGMESDYITVDQTPAGQMPRMVWGYRVMDASGGTESATEQVTGLNNDRGGYAVVFAADTSNCGEADPPTPGEWVFNELVAMGDGSTVTFTTEFPFIAGSLRVRYDTVDQTPQIAGVDPTTGEFTMTGPPIEGQQVFVDYQGI